MENNRINPGELDTLITVQSVTQTIGDRGQRKTAFTKYADVYAHLDRQVNEMVDEDNLESLETVDVLMYKISSLTTRWRLVISGVPYEIVAIDPISRYSAFNIITARTIRR